MGSHSVETVAVSDVVYPPMEKYSFGSQGFPPVYTKRGEIPCAAPWREEKPWRGSTGPSAAGGIGRVGVLLTHAANLYPEVKIPRRKRVFLSAGEGFFHAQKLFQNKEVAELKAGGFTQCRGSFAQQVVRGQCSRQELWLNDYSEFRPVFGHS